MAHLQHMMKYKATVHERAREMATIRPSYKALLWTVFNKQN